MQEFVAVDWGSSARRAYAVAADGRITDRMEDRRGALKIERDGFPEAVAELRERFGGRPLLMAGMVGSNRGWIEAPYVPCPATLADVAAQLVWPEPDAAIVPGLSLDADGRADIMRGEEVQVFGLMASGKSDAHATICHPGTHTKWIQVRDGTLMRFRTAMTGELYALLQDHSILRDLLTAPAALGPAFLGGVAQGRSGEGLAAELFNVRARVLLDRLDPAEAPSRISGLLIGSELRAGLADVEPGTEIIVLGRGSLTRLYAAAIAAQGHATRELDGAEAFIAGMLALKELIG